MHSFRSFGVVLQERRGRSRTSGVAGLLQACSDPSLRPESSRELAIRLSRPVGESKRSTASRPPAVREGLLTFSTSHLAQLACAHFQHRDAQLKSAPDRRLAASRHLHSTTASSVSTSSPAVQGHHASGRRRAARSGLPGCLHMRRRRLSVRSLPPCPLGTVVRPAGWWRSSRRSAGGRGSLRT